MWGWDTYAQGQRSGLRFNLLVMAYNRVHWCNYLFPKPTLPVWWPQLHWRFMLQICWLICHCTWLPQTWPNSLIVMMPKKFIIMSKIRHDIKKFIMTSEPRHNVKKFVMTSNIRHDVKKSVIMAWFFLNVKMSISSSWRQKHVITSKRLSWCQKVYQDVKKFVMT